MIHERVYCGRGDAENRIKDFKRALSGDRLSDTTCVANSFRLFLHALAYRLLDSLRRELVPIAPTLGRAQFDTLRLRLLKVATLVQQSVRRIVLRLPRAFGSIDVFARLAQRLGAALETAVRSTVAPIAASTAARRAHPTPIRAARRANASVRPKFTPKRQAGLRNASRRDRTRGHPRPRRASRGV